MNVKIIYDYIAWTCDSEHFTAIFVTWTEKNGSVKLYNVCCGVQDELIGEDDVDFSAESLGDYFVDELQNVGLDLFEDIDFICGDNCSTNKKLATEISRRIFHDKGRTNAWKVPLVGCNSHRLNLARQDYYSESSVAAIITKVDNLMRDLRSLKNASKLRKHKQLKPERRNMTRWSSTNKMLLKMKSLAPVIPLCGFPESVLQNVPSAFELLQIDEILQADEPFSSTSLALQREGSSAIDLSTTRILFDKLIEIQPSCSRRLGSDAPIVHSPLFETAVCKVLSFNEESLSRQEKEAIKRFLIDEDTADENPEDADSDQDWAQRLIDGAVSVKRQRVEKSRYRPMSHVSPTSNICERLFSTAKIIMRPHRKHMSPFHLEMLLFLRCNKELWNETLVEACLNEEV